MFKLKFGIVLRDIFALYCLQMVNNICLTLSMPRQIGGEDVGFRIIKINTPHATLIPNTEVGA